MRRRRLFIIPGAVLAVVAAITAAVLLRKEAPPEPVRLLPEGSAYLYMNLKPLRRADLLQKMPPVQLDPEYDTFVKETGFQFERDLKEAALAVHEPAHSTGSAASTAKEDRFSEVFDAKFDEQKLRSFLNKISKNSDNYRGLEIFNIPRENRIVRVCILGPELVAVSNVDDPEIIRGMVDRYKKLALPFGGPPLVKQYYRKLPFGTLAWAIADLGKGSTENTALRLPGGFEVFFPPNTVMIASIRYLGSIDFKARAITASAESAQRISDQFGAFLAIFRTLEMSASGGDPDVKTFFNSIKVQQSENQAVLTAELPRGFIQKVLTEPPPEIQPQTPAAAPQPAPAKPQHRRHHR